MARPKVSIQEKVLKEFPEFAQETQALRVEDLNARLATLAKNGEEIEDAKENDEQLEEARALASELAAPYRDGKKAVRLKARYIISLIREKGGEV